MSKLVVAIVASSLVAGLMITVTERVRRQSAAIPGPTQPDFLEFLEQTTPPCGSWPTAGALEPLKALLGETAASPLVMQCAGPSKVATRTLVSGDPSECSDWCALSRAKNPQMLCCELSRRDPGATCTASDGHAMLLSNATVTTTNAFAACSAPMLGSDPSQRYDCDSTNNMHDAMHITSKPPEPVKCAQICLPHGLFNIAQRHGVEEGHCSDWGYVDFEYSASRAGVKVRRHVRPCAMRPRAP